MLFGEKKKTIMLNGVAVGEYEASGDMVQDAKAVKEYLLSKGLIKETNEIDAMHRQANSFANTAKELYERDLRKNPRKELSIAPYIVNATFSIELYLKTLHFIFGKKVRGHALSELYKSLEEDAKGVINAAGLAVQRHYQLEKGPDIPLYLEDLNRSFEQWRYVYEFNGISVELQSIRFTIHTLHESCCRARGHKKT